MTLYGTGRALLGKRRHFRDDFTSLLSRWQVLAGTLTVSGGALQASALGDWGNNLIPNGEFTTDTNGWGASGGAVIQRRDYATSPAIAPTGGVDAWGLEIASAGDASARAYWLVTTAIAGATYTGRSRAYSPSANTVVNVANIEIYYGGGTSAYAPTTAEDTWQTLQGSAVAVSGAVPWGMRLRCASATSGDLAHFDAATAYRQNAAAIRNVAPAFRARLAHISPAAPSVVPAGWMFRYTGPLDYWELRLLPNTDGNDMQIVQVTAGAETVRAEADVDWTAEGTDEVELIVRGSSITTRYKKAGGVWTSGPSYSSATQGAQSPWMGPLVYGTTAARWARAEVDW